MSKLMLEETMFRILEDPTLKPGEVVMLPEPPVVYIPGGEIVIPQIEWDDEKMLHVKVRPYRQEAKQDNPMKLGWTVHESVGVCMVNPKAIRGMYWGPSPWDVFMEEVRKAHGSPESD